jgi:hypothetical protein
LLAPFARWDNPGELQGQDDDYSGPRALVANRPMATAVAYVRTRLLKLSVAAFAAALSAEISGTHVVTEGMVRGWERGADPAPPKRQGEVVIVPAYALTAAARLAGCTVDQLLTPTGARNQGEPLRDQVVALEQRLGELEGWLIELAAALGQQSPGRQGNQALNEDLIRDEFRTIYERLIRTVPRELHDEGAGAEEA